MLTNRLKFLNVLLFILIAIFLFLILLLFNENLIGTTIFAEFRESFFFKILFFSIFFIIISLMISFHKITNMALYKEEQKKVTELVQENKELRSFAKIDLITKQFNKEYFSYRYKQEFKRAIREELYLALILVDINEFSAYNELYGQDEGNICLKKVSDALVKQCSRPSDIVARFEEDIFYILLPNTKSAQKIADKCKKAVDNLDLDHDNSVIANIVRVKYGFASIQPKNISQLSELLLEAKQSLESKKQKHLFTSSK